MIVTLLLTVIVEAGVVIGYSAWRQKPLRPLLLTSLVGNLLTQSLLWIVLSISFRFYLITLLIAEVFIWAIEALFLYFIPANKLTLQEAAILSLAMNLSSLALGWLLPV